VKPVILKPGKEKPLLNRHHWVFSGAVQTYPDFSNGDILPVVTAQGHPLGFGYFNRKGAIVGRMISFDATPPLDALKHHLDNALSYRETLKQPHTTAYRLVNGEGDLLPGLIVDRYGDTIVMQLNTLGMDQLRPILVDYFVQKLDPKTIFEKSTGTARKEEGLKDSVQFLYGEQKPFVTILENGLKYNVSLLEGQKTGFFLDHREMRKKIRELSHQKRVLNAFAYTGGFTVSALAGGAARVDTVEISAQALMSAKENVKLNSFTVHSDSFHQADVFDYLRQQPLQYDLIILDPPAFAKRQKDIIPACRGYKDINRISLQKMPPNSILLTCSCSYFVNADLFQKVLFQAAVEAKRNVRIIGKHILAPDHPINLCHPETDYLKSFLLYVE
jgi:23S rRNA (cytosine1962-C5)-methyltransferase